VIVAVITAAGMGLAVVVVDGVVNGACQPRSEVVRMNKGMVFGREIVEGKSCMNGKEEW
jgi:hypothetical protein